MSNIEKLRPLRWQPTGTTEHIYPELDAVIYTTDEKKPWALAYIGRATKPRFNYTFPTIKRRDEYVAEWLQSQQRQHEQNKIAAAKLAEFKKTFKNPYSIGDILYNSWGWEQTNIDFYQVIELKSRALIVREINQDRVYSHSMAGDTSPVPDAFVSDPQKINIRISAGYNGGDPHVCLKSKHGYMGLWDGQPKYFSQYA